MTTTRDGSPNVVMRRHDGAWTMTIDGHDISNIVAEWSISAREGVPSEKADLHVTIPCQTLTVEDGDTA